MDYFGIHLDEAKNEVRSKELREITTQSKTKILVIPTNEELDSDSSAKAFFE
jgi:acetate kinase